MDSTLERLVQGWWKLASAAPEEVAADSIPETVFQKPVSVGKALDLVQVHPHLTFADPEEAAVDSTPETPVQTSQKQAFAGVAVRSPELLLPKNAADVAVHSPEPLLLQNTVPAGHPVPDPHRNTADSPEHPRQPGSHLADLLVEGGGFRAAGSL